MQKGHYLITVHGKTEEKCKEMYNDKFDEVEHILKSYKFHDVVIDYA